MMRFLISMAVLCGLLLSGGNGMAAERMRGDHDRARAAFERGEIRPLDDILTRLRSSYPGRLLRVNLDHENDNSQRWIYQILLMGGDGKVTRLRIDARTADVISAEAGPPPRGPRPPMGPPKGPPGPPRPGELPATRPAAVR